MSAALVRAIVVGYRSRSQLPACLASLAEGGRELARLGSGEGALEVVVVDNGSDDGTPEWLAREAPGVRCLAQAENLGFGAAVNRGARGAEAAALLLLNPDARLLPGALPALRERMQAEPRAALVAPRLIYPDGRAQLGWAPGAGLVADALQSLRSRHESSRLLHGGTRALLAPLCVGWYSGAALLLRRAAFEQIGGFDEGYFLYYEDVDLCARLKATGWRLLEEPRARVEHARGGSWSERSAREYRRSQWRYYRTHRPRWEQLCLRRYLLARFGSSWLAEVAGA